MLRTLSRIKGAGLRGRSPVLRLLIALPGRMPRRLHIFFTIMARAQLGAQDYDRAADTARKTINQRPDYPHSHYILASALGHLGRLDEARAELAECERLQPGYIERRLGWSPYQNAVENEHLHAGVRAAQADQS